MQRGRNVQGAAKRGKGEIQHCGSSPDSGVGLLPEKLMSAPARGGYLLCTVDISLLCSYRRETAVLFPGPSAFNSFKGHEES